MGGMMTETEYANSIVDEWLADPETVPFRVFAAMRSRATVAEAKVADLQRQLDEASRLLRRRRPGSCLGF